MADHAAEVTAALDALVDRLDEVVARLDSVTEKVDLHESTVRGANFASRTALVGLVADMILTVLVGVGLFGVDQNQGRITDLQTQLRIETDRNRAAQCAVNALFIQFEPRTLSNPTYSEEQRQQQKAAYATLRQISADLGCTK